MVRQFKKLWGVERPRNQRDKEKKPHRQLPAHSTDPFVLYQMRDKRILEVIANNGADEFLDEYYEAREQCRSDSSAMKELLNSIEDPTHRRLYKGLYNNYLIYLKSQTG